MSYLRFGILLLTLLIISDSFSLVLAQSIYDFKRKGTNVGQQIMDPYTKNIKLTQRLDLGIYMDQLIQILKLPVQLVQ